MALPALLTAVTVTENASPALANSALPAAALEQVLAHLLELRARQVLAEVLRARRVHRDERQVDLGRCCRRQFDLGFFGSFLEPLKSQLVLRQVDAFGLLEFRREEFDDCRVKILTTDQLKQEGAQMGHCIGGGAYDDKLNKGTHAFYSLRDKYNKSHATFEVEISLESCSF